MRFYATALVALATSALIAFPATATPDILTSAPAEQRFDHISIVAM